MTGRLHSSYYKVIIDGNIECINVNSKCDYVYII